MCVIESINFSFYLYLQFVTNFLPSIMVSSRRPSRRILQFGNDSGLGIFRRIFPSTLPVDDVDRSYVPASLRNRTRREVRDYTPADIPEQFIDPNLPSTSSGLDSIGDNSRSRSPNTSLEGNASSSTRSNKKSKTKTTKRKKKLVKSSKRNSSSIVREVRITELNDDGEEEEIVTYVKVASSTSRRKCKKRTKKTRKVYR